MNHIHIQFKIIENQQFNFKKFFFWLPRHPTSCVLVMSVQIEEVKAGLPLQRIHAHSHVKGLGLNAEGIAEEFGGGLVGQTKAREVCAFGCVLGFSVIDFWCLGCWCCSRFDSFKENGGESGFVGRSTWFVFLCVAKDSFLRICPQGRGKPPLLWQCRRNWACVCHSVHWLVQKFIPLK